MRPLPSRSLTPPPPCSPAQALCQGGWRASFEELSDVDHFEIIENLTQKDDALTQVGRSPSHCLHPPITVGCMGAVEGVGGAARRSHLAWVSSIQKAGAWALMMAIICMSPPSETAPGISWEGPGTRGVPATCAMGRLQRGR